VRERRERERERERSKEREKGRPSSKMTYFHIKRKKNASFAISMS
jgi:hypothetical protein